MHLKSLFSMMCLILPIKGMEVPWICTDFKTDNNYFKAPSAYYFGLHEGQGSNAFYSREATVERSVQTKWARPYNWLTAILVRSPSLTWIIYKYPFCNIELLDKNNIVTSCSLWSNKIGRYTQKWKLSKNQPSVTLHTDSAPRAIYFSVSGVKQVIISRHTFSYSCRELTKMDILDNQFCSRFGISSWERQKWYDSLPCGSSWGCGEFR